MIYIAFIVMALLILYCITICNRMRSECMLMREEIYKLVKGSTEEVKQPVKEIPFKKKRPPHSPEVRKKISESMKRSKEERELKATQRPVEQPQVF